MDAAAAWTLLGGASLVVLVAAGISILVGARRRRAPEAPRDDTKRVGDDSTATPGSAADRATGSTSWMRPGGGPL